MFVYIHDRLCVYAVLDASRRASAFIVSRALVLRLAGRLRDNVEFACHSCGLVVVCVLAARCGQGGGRGNERAAARSHICLCVFPFVCVCVPCGVAHAGKYGDSAAVREWPPLLSCIVIGSASCLHRLPSHHTSTRPCPRPVAPRVITVCARVAAVCMGRVA